MFDFFERLSYSHNSQKVIDGRGVCGLGWTGFDLTRSNVNGFDPSSNPKFHCQNRLEPTRSFMGWVGLRSRDCVLNKKYIFL